MNDLGIKEISSYVEPVRGMWTAGTPIKDEWAIILAGGDGTRLLPLTRKISGDERPKQFCRIIGNETLLDQTRQRVATKVEPGRTMFVLTKKHERFYDIDLADVPRQNLIVQPENAGTAPAILYSLLRLSQKSPTASVAFFPSDHYFSNSRAFMADVGSAFTAVTSDPNLVFLLGIQPESPDEEYGWIEALPSFLGAERSFQRVHRFWEKPSPETARELMGRGCLWNSFVMVGKVSAFLRMIKFALPSLYQSFATVQSWMGTPEEPRIMGDLYAHTPHLNFSSEVLEMRSADLAVIPVRNSKWSDLGSPVRVSSTISEIGLSASGSSIEQSLAIELPERLYEIAGNHYVEAVGV